LRAVERSHPNVAIADIRMPPTNKDEGLRAARAIRERFPQTAVLVLSQYVDADYVLGLLERGGQSCGYLLKERILRGSELVEALHRLDRGETVVDPQIVDDLLQRARQPNPLERLTPREQEILALMAEGLTDRGIAKRLWLSPKTVESHIRHILQKLGLPEDRNHNRRVEAVLTYLHA
jgi:serine/threonine-protein kinase